MSQHTEIMKARKSVPLILLACVVGAAWIWTMHKQSQLQLNKILQKRTALHSSNIQTISVSGFDYKSKGSLNIKARWASLNVAMFDDAPYLNHDVSLAAAATEIFRKYPRCDFCEFFWEIVAFGTEDKYAAVYRRTAHGAKKLNERTLAWDER